MKRLILLASLFLTAPAHADLVHKLSSSTQLTVNGAATQAIRVPSTYAVSGSNVVVSSANNSVFGGLTAGSATAAATMKAGTYDISTDGSPSVSQNRIPRVTPYQQLDLVLMSAQGSL